MPGIALSRNWVKESTSPSERSNAGSRSWVQWRGTHRALLESGHLEALTPQLAEQAGKLLAGTGGSNAVDATVVASAALRGDLVVTGDERDLRALAEFAPGVTVERLR